MYWNGNKIWDSRRMEVKKNMPINQQIYLPLSRKRDFIVKSIDAHSHQWILICVLGRRDCCYTYMRAVDKMKQIWMLLNCLDIRQLGNLLLTLHRKSWNLANTIESMNPLMEFNCFQTHFASRTNQTHLAQLLFVYICRGIQF